MYATSDACGNEASSPGSSSGSRTSPLQFLLVALATVFLVNLATQAWPQHIPAVNTVAFVATLGYVAMGRLPFERGWLTILAAVILALFTSFWFEFALRLIALLTGIGREVLPF